MASWPVLYLLPARLRPRDSFLGGLDLRLERGELILEVWEVGSPAVSLEYLAFDPGRCPNQPVVETPPRSPLVHLFLQLLDRLGIVPLIQLQALVRQDVPLALGACAETPRALASTMVPTARLAARGAGIP